jgi:hypothetical protein
MSSNLIVGTQIRIVATKEVQSNHPTLIGKTGTIEELPESDTGSFLVRIQSSKALVKLSDDALVLDNTSITASKPNIEQSVVHSRPRSNSSPGIHLHTSSYYLKEGMKVAIIGTENVIQRVPHLVGKIGTIKEAPGMRVSLPFLYSLFVIDIQALSIVASAQCIPRRGSRLSSPSTGWSHSDPPRSARWGMTASPCPTLCMWGTRRRRRTSRPMREARAAAEAAERTGQVSFSRPNAKPNPS